MRSLLKFLIIFIIPSLAAGVYVAACSDPIPVTNSSANDLPVAKWFVYPVGEGRFVTQAKDSVDGWYNAQDFGVNSHLGEDWNRNTGGNTDCGEPVRSAADGKVTYADDAGLGWGNVLIVTHRLESGDLVQTLYGHLKQIDKDSGTVKIGERLGSVGDANGRYPCHLHFELRLRSSPAWDEAGPGYSESKSGWADPSNFIDMRLPAKFP